MRLTAHCHSTDAPCSFDCRLFLNLAYICQVAVCAGTIIPSAAHTWAGDHAGGGSTGASTQDVVDSDVIRTVERATKAAAAIGSGGVWLTGPGSGCTDVVAAAAQALGEARPA